MSLTIVGIPKNHSVFRLALQANFSQIFHLITKYTCLINFISELVKGINGLTYSTLKWPQLYMRLITGGSGKLFNIFVNSDRFNLLNLSIIISAGFKIRIIVLI